MNDKMRDLAIEQIANRLDEYANDPANEDFDDEVMVNVPKNHRHVYLGTELNLIMDHVDYNYVLDIDNAVINIDEFDLLYVNEDIFHTKNPATDGISHKIDGVSMSETRIKYPKGFVGKHKELGFIIYSKDCSFDLKHNAKPIDNTNLNFIYYSSNRVFGKMCDYEQIIKWAENVQVHADFKVEDKTYIHLVGRAHSDFNTRRQSIEAIEMDLDSNYNDSLYPFHKKIGLHLSDEKNSGLILMHGIPGTGKTSYIHYLVNEFTDRKFIYVPPSVAAHISSPEFANWLTREKNAVLIIEDAETILKSRESAENSAVANILNMTSGFLSKAVQLTVICTFNTDLNNIDPALLRKGRLKGSYEFKKLSLEKTKALAQKLEIDVEFKSPSTLADIYNATDEDPLYKDPSTPKIGFLNS